MKKILIISAIVIPSCLFLGGTKYAGSYRIEKLAQHLYAVIDLYHPSPGVTVNAAFLATTNSLVFIDAGMNRDSAEAIWTEAHKRFPGKTKNYLILTHFHCDHTFGMGFFKARGTKVIAHREIDPWLDQEKFKKRLLKTAGKAWTFPQVIAFETYPSPAEAEEILGQVELSSPDVLITQDQVIEVEELKLGVLHVPGHSPDLLAVYEPLSRTLFASDLVYGRQEPFLHDKTKTGFEDWIASLKRIRELSIIKVVPGHGPVSEKKVIDENIRSLELQLQKFIK
ncbi:MAG: hypothetical protein A2028_03970 [Candidatus Aminicenantes bacterium RBG_19FT_COMBO_59_29]|nr:MAG: hypothetical protein A2028_03970 [Candidatus Aminicenantes bacterium RBG_19FT_COMBO_59_29]